MKKLFLFLVCICIVVSGLVVPVAMADEVTTIYDFQGSSFYTSVALFKQTPFNYIREDGVKIVYTPVVFSRMQFSFIHQESDEFIAINAVVFIPGERYSDGAMIYGGEIAGESKTISATVTADGTYKYVKGNLDPSSAGENRRNLDFLVKCDNDFNSNVVKVSFGSKEFSPLSDWQSNGFINTLNYSYNYVTYTDIDGNVCTIVWCNIASSSLGYVIPENGDILTAEALKQYVSFTPREYFLTLELSDEDVWNQAYESGKLAGSTEGYNNGYNVGKTEGYNNGFNVGYSQAIEDEAGDLATLGGFGNFVMSLLNIKIFGLFGLGDLLAVGVGGAVLFFVIKMLRG